MTNPSTNPGNKAQPQELNQIKKLMRQGKTDEALPLLEQLIARDSSSAEAQFQYALALKEEGRYTLSFQFLESALELEPGHIPALNLQAELLKGTNNPNQALRVYARVLEQDERNREALVGVASIYTEQMVYLDKAIDFLQRALTLEPGNSRTLTSLAFAHYLTDQDEEALKYGQRAIKADPKDAWACSVLGELQLGWGNKAEANRLLLRAIELAPREGGFYLGLFQSKKATEEDLPLLRKMEGLLQDSLTIPSRYCIHGALGKAYDDLKEYPRAFDHFTRANQLQRVDYDRAKEQKDLDAIRRVYPLGGFDRQALPQQPTTNETTQPRPIFIVGMPRSGSTLADKILASHSQVSSIGESSALLSLLEQRTAASTSPYPQYLQGWTPADYAALAQDYRQAVARDTPLVVDKQLVHFSLLGLIARAFPDACIIHTRRHPLDTCLSCYFQVFDGATGPAWSKRLEDLGYFYGIYRQYMAHWRQLLPQQMLELDYEDMVADTEGQARRLLDHCGLAWEPQVLEFYKQRQMVKTSSVGQVSQPIYRSSLNRWLNYRDQIQPLVDALGDLFSEAEREELARHGLRVKRPWYRAWF
jgi:tetratricopeptide (TPR) repeat protein